MLARRGYVVDQAGAPVTILVDGGKLLRAVRFALGGEGPVNIADLPATIAAAASGKVSPQLTSILSEDPTLCGYRPECVQQGSARFSWGLYMSVLCRDEAPFVDADALSDAIGGDATYRAVFEDDPYLAACDLWDVLRASVRSPGTLLDVPMLMMVGQFDSYSSKPIAEAAARTMPVSFLLEVPGQTHNVMGYDECPIQIRNAWVLHPGSPPADTSCLSTMHTTFSTVP